MTRESPKVGEYRVAPEGGWYRVLFIRPDISPPTFCTRCTTAQVASAGLVCPNCRRLEVTK